MIITNDTVTLEYKKIYDLCDTKIVFPIFQRYYSWKEAQTENILNEILSLSQLPAEDRSLKQLYLLDFIWYADDDGAMLLADGQQRLVTLNLLILAINNYILASGKDIHKLDPFNLSYEDDDLNKVYTKFLEKNGSVSIKPFFKVYSHMEKFIKENDKYLLDVIDIVKNNIFIYLKKTSNVDDAFDIFTQINSGGKPLTKDDVISSTIQQYSKRYGISFGDYDFKDIKNLIISYHKFINTGVARFDNLELMSFLNKQVVNTKENFIKFKKYLESTKKVNDLAIYKVVEYIGKKQILSIMYAMSISGIDLSKERKYVENVIFPLCLLSIVWKIKKVSPGGISVKIFEDVLSAVKSNKSPEDILNIILRFVSEYSDMCKIPLSDLEKGLGAELDQNCKKAILILDIIMNNTSGEIKVSSINLEHIFPQKPTNPWILNGWPGTQDEQDMLIGSIGNYMLLSESVNKKIQNSYISDKVHEYEKIIPKDRILQTKMNTVDFKAFESRRSGYIYERQREIARMIQSDFIFGKVLVVD